MRKGKIPVSDFDFKFWSREQYVSQHLIYISSLFTTEEIGKEKKERERGGEEKIKIFVNLILLVRRPSHTNKRLVFYSPSKSPHKETKKIA